MPEFCYLMYMCLLWRETTTPLNTNMLVDYTFHCSSSFAWLNLNNINFEDDWRTNDTGPVQSWSIIIIIIIRWYVTHITYCICTNLYFYLSLFITVWILSLDYLKNSYDYDFQIFTVSLPWWGIDTISFSACSLNHDVI